MKKQAMVFAVIVIAVLVVIGLNFYGCSSDDNPNKHNSDQKNINDYVEIIDPKVVVNYHDSDNPGECTSLEFKGTFKNLTDGSFTLFTTFVIKDSDGFALERDNGFYKIEGAGTKEPRVLAVFGPSGRDYNCEDVDSIELECSIDGIENTESIDLPIIY